MTSSPTVDLHHGEADLGHAPYLRPRLCDPLEQADVAPHRGFAVVEILGDGTLGSWEVVTAPGPQDAARAAAPPRSVTSSDHLEAALALRLGLQEAARGHLPSATRWFLAGATSASTGLQRQECLANLALVEAYRGQLCSSEAHSSEAEQAHPARGGTALRLAEAWRRFERGEVDDARRSIDLLKPMIDPFRDPWLATVAALLMAELLLVAGRPASAVRVLGDATDDADTHPRPAWSTDVIAAARAYVLLAEGEPHRALAAVTPLPTEATVEAAVVAADARATIGDVRGAQAVLAAVADRVDVARLGVQVRAWLLEARLADRRGDPARSRVLADRALHAASAEGMHHALWRDRRWVRALADRDPVLLHEHRDILMRTAGTESGTADQRVAVPSPLPSPEQSSPLVGTRLTQREAEVLELLAEMYTTEEIATALFVSGNTVKTHLKGIFTKLGVNRRVDAVRRGRQLGLC